MLPVGTRAHCLHDIVLAGVRSCGAQNENKRDKTEEGRHHGKVWSKAKLQDTVGIGAANYDCDKESDDDGTNGELRAGLNGGGAGLGHERAPQLDVGYSVRYLLHVGYHELNMIRLPKSDDDLLRECE